VIIAKELKCNIEFHFFQHAFTNCIPRVTSISVAAFETIYLHYSLLDKGLFGLL